MKIGILTSGGDAPGMNNAIRALVRAGIHSGFSMVGINNGYEGMIDGDFVPMSISSVGDILHRGGTVLGTSRSSRFREEAGRAKAIANLEREDIGAIVVIGGEGSMKGAFELAKKGVTCMFLPGTIDNDIGYTDYTIGFDTAVNTVLNGISNIRDTASAHGRSTLIEVMGRRCGDIALLAGIAGGADVILIPEVEIDLNKMAIKLLESKDRGKKHNIVIKAEGVSVDNKEISDKILDTVGRETNIVVMSYLQRGGMPTAIDRVRGSMMAIEAIKLIERGMPSYAIGMEGTQVIKFPIGEAIEMKKEADLDKIAIIDILSK